jgi:uncharacterized protein (DUF2062 family)
VARSYTTVEGPSAMADGVGVLQLQPGVPLDLAQAKAAQQEMKGGWRRKLRETLSGDTRPAAIATAVALGIFLGCTPFYGVQTFLVFGFAALFRLNPFAAFLGSQISILPLGLGIMGAEVAVGEWMRYGHWAMPKIGGAAETAKWLWGHALYSWAIGSALLGGALAAGGGLFAWGALVYFRSWRARRGQQA